MAANPIDLTTLANAKEWLAIPPSTTAKDALIQRLITAASQAIMNWCGRAFKSAVYTDVVSGSGGCQHYLSQWPVTAVASVSVDWRNVPASPGSGQPGYVFDETTLTMFGRVFTRAKMNVSVTYTAGFATVPFDLEQACLDVLGSKFREMDRIGMVSKQLAGEVITFSQKDFSDSTKTCLQQYKKVVPA